MLISIKQLLPKSASLALTGSQCAAHAARLNPANQRIGPTEPQADCLSEKRDSARECMLRSARATTNTRCSANPELAEESFDAFPRFHSTELCNTTHCCAMYRKPASRFAAGLGTCSLGLLGESWQRAAFRAVQHVSVSRLAAMTHFERGHEKLQIARCS